MLVLVVATIAPFLEYRLAKEYKSNSEAGKLALL